MQDRYLFAQFLQTCSAYLLVIVCKLYFDCSVVGKLLIEAAEVTAANISNEGSHMPLTFHMCKSVPAADSNRYRLVQIIEHTRAALIAHFCERSCAQSLTYLCPLSTLSRRPVDVLPDVERTVI
jgi:hypothetical protein